MAFYYSPKVNMEGLILYVDAANPKSYQSGSSTWYDLSGNNNHFTLYNTPTFDGSGITFNGQYARSTNQISDFSTPAVTTLVVVEYFSGETGVTYELSDNISNNSPTFLGYLSFPGEYIGIIKGDAGLNSMRLDSPGVVLNQTNFLTVTMDSSQVAANEVFIYSSGEKATNTTKQNSTETSFSNYKTDYLYLGSRAGSSLFSNMKLYSFMMYNRALTATEIKQNYLATRGRFL